MCMLVFFFQAEDGIRDFCLSRGLGDVYKRQGQYRRPAVTDARTDSPQEQAWSGPMRTTAEQLLRYRLTTSGLVLTLVDPHGSGLWRLSRPTDGLELLTLAGAGPELLRCG